MHAGGGAVEVLRNRGRRKKVQTGWREVTEQPYRRHRSLLQTAARNPVARSAPPPSWTALRPFSFLSFFLVLLVIFFFVFCVIFTQ